jgi:phospholipase A1
MTQRIRLLPFVIGVTLSAASHAQESTPAVATPEACFSIESDAARLACYDSALGRSQSDTRQADEQARAAKAAEAQARAQAKAAADADAEALDGKDTLGEHRQRRLGAWFRADDPSDEAVIANAGRGSLLDSRWELAKDSKLGVFQMRGYKPVYLLPAFWTSSNNERPSSPNPNNTVTEAQDLQDVEAKFQLSFKTKFAENLFGDNGDLWGAYTQSSRWQVYNSDQSRPFRETNYEPEVMLVFRNSYSLGGWKGRMTGISLNHQSNGRGDPLSRSWNRLIGSVGLDRENWALVMRAWHRFDEDASDDNNADILDYVGRGDAMLTYTRDGHILTVLGRHSLRGGDQSHGALQVDYGFPINRAFRAHVQLFHGYGESLIDYNHKATYIGLGISLLDWY